MPEPAVSDPTDPQPTLEPRSRRALLAGGLGGLAGLLAGALSRPLRSRAAAGDPLILGSTTNTSGSAGTKLSSSVNGNAFAVSQTGSGNSANGIRGDARAVASRLTGPAVEIVNDAAGGHGLSATATGADGASSACPRTSMVSSVNR